MEKTELVVVIHEATTKFCWTWQKKEGPLWQLAKDMFFSYFENQTFLRFHSKRKGDIDSWNPLEKIAPWQHCFCIPGRTMNENSFCLKMDGPKWTCKIDRKITWMGCVLFWVASERAVCEPLCPRRTKNANLTPWLRFQTSFLLQRSPEVVFCTGMNQGGFGWRVAKGECANQQLLLTNSILMLYVLFKVWVVLCVRMIQCLYHPRMS